MECTKEWLAGEAVQGVDGIVRTAIVVDASRSHSGREEIYVGGLFQVAGKAFAYGVAMWDGTRWSALGSGLSDAARVDIENVTALPNGDIVVAGRFDHAGGLPASKIARWDGTHWHALGLGPTAFGPMDSLSDGRLVVSSSGKDAQGNVIRGIAIWDGVAWMWRGIVKMNDGSPGVINDLKVLSDGRVVVVGRFEQIGGLPISQAAIVDPVSDSCTSIGDRPLAGTVWNVSSLPDGDIVVAGTPAATGGAIAPFVARCSPSGGPWTIFGTSATLPVGSSSIVMATDTLGRVYIGGDHRRYTDDAWGIFRSDGGDWQLVGPDLYGSIFGILPRPDGRVLAAGAKYGIQQLADGAWQSVNTVTSFHPWDMVQSSDGRVFALVAIDDSSGADYSVGLYERIADQWQPIETRFDKLPSHLKLLRGGDLLVFGSFGKVGDVAADKIARFNGSQWLPVGQGIPGKVNDIEELSDGTLYAAVNQAWEWDRYLDNFFRLDANAWVPIGGGVRGNNPWDLAYPTDLAVLPNDDVVICGKFTLAGAVSVRNIARWDGAAWHAMGTGLGAPEGTSAYVSRITFTGDGEVYACGHFYPGADVQRRNVAHWNSGTQSWEELPGIRFTDWDSDVAFVTPIEPSKLLIVGAFGQVNDLQVGSAIVWDRETHEVSRLGPGFGSRPDSVVVRANGDMWAGGFFDTVGDRVANGFAIWTCPCTADFDHDGIVTFEDFDAFVLAMERGEAVADLDHDGMITFSDFDAFVLAFTQGC